MTKTIDLTPTWSAILPVLLEGYEQASPDGRRIALEELQRMASLADRYAASVKEDRPR